MPTDRELLEVAREEAVIYDDKLTMFTRDELVRVLRAVVKHFTAPGEPVAWMHDGENRLDICHDTIKNLLIAAKCGKQVEHYTIPLYANDGVIPRYVDAAGARAAAPGELVTRDGDELRAEVARAPGVPVTSATDRGPGE